MNISLLIGSLIFLQVKSYQEVENQDTPKNHISKEEVRDIRHKFVGENLVSAGQAKPPDQTYISVGAIVCDVRAQKLNEGYLEKMRKMIDSVLTHSLGTPLHLVIITDKPSFEIVHAATLRTIGLYITETLLIFKDFIPWDTLTTVPKIWIEFVDITSITDVFRQEIDLMKKQFSLNITENIVVAKENDVTMVTSPKYSKDLFYLGPFYGNAFTQIKRLIMFDADLQVKKDLSNLDNYFDLMNSTELIGLPPEQTGYYSPLVNKLKNGKDEEFILTDDQLKIQGSNTGVVLYHLGKMRESVEYQSAISLENIEGIKKKLASLTVKIGFKVGGICGDQEFFTLLMWRLPHLFKMIPCSWNFQSMTIMHSRDYTCKLEPFILHQHNK